MNERELRGAAFLYELEKRERQRCAQRGVTWGGVRKFANALRDEPERVLSGFWPAYTGGWSGSTGRLGASCTRASCRSRG